MIVPKLKSHKEGAAVNYLSCCMKIGKKSVQLSCSLAQLSLARVGDVPVLHSFLALRTRSSFRAPPPVNNQPVLFPWFQHANCTYLQQGHALDLCHAMGIPVEIPQPAETWQAQSTLWFIMGRANSGAIQPCHESP